MDKHIENYLATMVQNRMDRDINKEFDRKCSISEETPTILNTFEQIDPLLYSFMKEKHPDMIIDNVGFFANQFCIKYLKVMEFNEANIKSRAEYWIKRGWK